MTAHGEPRCPLVFTDNYLPFTFLAPNPQFIVVNVVTVMNISLTGIVFIRRVNEPSGLLVSHFLVGFLRYRPVLYPVYLIGDTFSPGYPPILGGVLGVVFVKPTSGPCGWFHKGFPPPEPNKNSSLFGDNLF